MARASWCLAFVCAAGCSRSEPAPPADVPIAKDHGRLDATGETGCQHVPFAASTNVVEASGATLLSDGSIMVVGDSDTGGGFAVISSEHGGEIRRGRLPVDKRVSDDIEGLSVRGDRLHALASNGFMQVFDLAASPTRIDSYRIGEPPWSCPNPRHTNCGPNYEGLCLLPSGETNGCVGFAASKSNGNLYCLVENADRRMSVDPTRAIEIGGRSVAGCHFGPNGSIWIGHNIAGGNRVERIDNWPLGPVRTDIDARAMGLGIAEAIVVGRQGGIFRFMDNALHSPSPMAKYQCSPPGPDRPHAQPALH